MGLNDSSAKSRLVPSRTIFTFSTTALRSWTIFEQLSALSLVLPSSVRVLTAWETNNESEGIVSFGRNDCTTIAMVAEKMKWKE